MAQRGGFNRVPPFDKENYGLWKRKMLLYIKASNPKYMQVLQTGPIVHYDNAIQDEETGLMIARKLKNPDDLSEKEKEEASLDDNL